MTIIGIPLITIKGETRMNIELEHTQKMLDWLKTILYLDSIAKNASTRSIKRGQVYLCNFGFGIGSEMQKERPALIIQNNVANSCSSNTIVFRLPTIKTHYLV